MRDKLKIGIIQQSNISDTDTNRRKLADKIRSLARHGAELVILQELHDSLYFCQTEDTAKFDLATTLEGEPI